MPRSAALRVIAVLAMTLSAAPAQAAPQCGRRDAVVDLLASRYGETPRSRGGAPRGAVVEIFASEATGTWTITLTLPDGTTCLVASGDRFRSVAPSPPGEDA
ncbi:MAG: hypothetical protein ACOY4T_15575 [Pseudomonadota bacterium]